MRAFALALVVMSIPSLASADESEFRALEPVETRFGEPGTFIIDASGSHALVEPATERIKFSSLHEFVEHMQWRFNALPVEREDEVVGFELDVQVLGKAFYPGADGYLEARSPVALMLAGTSGFIEVAGIDICLLIGCLDPERYVIDAAVDIKDPFPPEYTVEGRIKLNVSNSICSPLGWCSMGWVEATTIEHDPYYAPTEISICYDSNGIKYPCIRVNDRDNYLMVHASQRVTRMRAPGDPVVDVRFFEAESFGVSQISASSLVWEMTFVAPLEVRIEGTHFGESYSTGGADWDWTALNASP